MPAVSPLQDDAGLASSSRAYVYGVIGRRDATPLSREGVGGAKIAFVDHGAVAALMSTVPARGEIRARRRDLLRHSEVLQEALEHGTVLPLRFGTVLAGAESVVTEFLAPRHDELVGLLDELDGLVELSVRAFYREESVLAEVVRDDTRVARLRDETSRGASRARHVELGEAVAHALEGARARDADAILGAVRAIAHDVSVQERQSDLEVLRASFLVERAEVGPFDRAMDELARLRGGTVLFKYVGPLPPHSFVSLQLEGV